MSTFQLFNSLRPYFHSIREIGDNVSLDLKFPVSWEIDSIVAVYKSVKIKVQDKNDKFNLVSLITYATSEGYDIVFACAKEIIEVNKEIEEKRKLFQEKVKELEILFQNESLDKLKEITFLDESAEQENTAGLGVVGEGDGERPSGDIEPQEEVD